MTKQEGSGKGFLNKIIKGLKGREKEDKKDPVC
jgi:hypothetical protein